MCAPTRISGFWQCLPGHHGKRDAGHLRGDPGDLGAGGAAEQGDKRKIRSIIPVVPVFPVKPGEAAELVSLLPFVFMAPSIGDFPGCTLKLKFAVV